jgi:hypothetical protein
MNSRTLLVPLIAFVICAAGEAGASEEEKLSLRVSPNVSSAPTTVVVRAMVTPDADNRWLVVEADSGSFYRSSSIQLDGDNAPLVSEFTLRNLPSGKYAVSAVLRDRHGEETMVSRTVIVLSKWGEPQ